MIWRDSHGFAVSSINSDGGDSCHFTNFLVLAGKESPEMSLSFLNADGLAVRHPLQEPWNNPWNCTVDQISMLVAGLNRGNYRSEAKKLLIGTLKRFCFAQNFEYDCPGTKKRPWPHLAVRCRGETKRVWFDFADFTGPQYVCQMYVASRLPFWQIARIIALPFFILEALTFRWGQNDDQGRALAVADTIGFLKLYKRLVPNWEAKCESYFTPRGLGGLGKVVVNWLREI